MKRSLNGQFKSRAIAFAIVTFAMYLNMALFPADCFAAELENDDSPNVTAPSQNGEKGDDLTDVLDVAEIQSLPNSETLAPVEEPYGSDSTVDIVDAVIKRDGYKDGKTPDDCLVVQGSADMMAAAGENDQYANPALATVHSAEMEVASAQGASIASGVYTIVASTGGSKCLDVPNGSSANGVQLQLFTQNLFISKTSVSTIIFFRKNPLQKAIQMNFLNVMT